MTTRRPLTRAQKLGIFNRHHGICHICQRKIHAGEQWEAEHVIPLWAGGEDTPENMAPAHLDPCHRGKTSGEATDRAKELRMQANYRGIPKPGKKLPGGRNSDFKKKISGPVVPRLKERGAEYRRVMEKLYPWGIPE